MLTNDRDDERNRAVATVLNLLPDATPEAFDAWYNAVRDGTDGAFLLYGLHATHIVRFDRSEAGAVKQSLHAPAAAATLCEDVLNLSPDRLGGLDDVHICLRLDDTNGGHLVVLERAGVEAVLANLFPAASLTPAETRTLLQVVCGTPLKEAAAEDGVRYETKRSQLKAVSAKTGRRGQRELVGFILARLMFDLTRAPSASAKRDDALHDYHRRFLPSQVQIHVVEGSNGSRHRLLDFGERSGRVLIVLHSQVMPSLSDADIEVCSALGLRLIWPLRHGALDPDAPLLSFDEHTAHVRAGIDAARQLFTGERAVLLCLMSACWYGIDYARRHPERVKRLVFVGACYQPTLGGGAQGRLRDGLVRLSRQHRMGAALLLRFIGHRLGDPERMGAFLKTLYTESPADTAVLAVELDNPQAREALMLRFLLSASSIAQDFLHLGFPNFDVLETIDTPVAFVHGAEDPVHPLTGVISLAKSIEAPLTILEGAGQLLYGAHWSTVLSAAAEAAGEP